MPASRSTDRLVVAKISPPVGRLAGRTAHPTPLSGKQTLAPAWLQKLRSEVPFFLFHGMSGRWRPRLRRTLGRLYLDPIKAVADQPAQDPMNHAENQDKVLLRSGQVSGKYVDQRNGTANQSDAEPPYDPMMNTEVQGHKHSCLLDASKGAMAHTVEAVVARAAKPAEPRVISAFCLGTLVRKSRDDSRLCRPGGPRHVSTWERTGRLCHSKRECRPSCCGRS